jgi:hypothetical protein
VCYVLCNKVELVSDLLLCGFSAEGAFANSLSRLCNAWQELAWNGTEYGSIPSQSLSIHVKPEQDLGWNTAVPQIPYFTTADTLIPDFQSFGGRLETVADS